MNPEQQSSRKQIQFESKSTRLQPRWWLIYVYGRRQILVLTYPLVGNYGVPSQPTAEWAESNRIWAGRFGAVVRIRPWITELRKRAVGIFAHKKSKNCHKTCCQMPKYFCQTIIVFFLKKRNKGENDEDKNHLVRISKLVCAGSGQRRSGSARGIYENVFAWSRIRLF